MADRMTAERWHALSAADAVARVSSSPEGLTSEEAAARLRGVGPNRLARTPPTPAVRILLRQLASVVVGVLAAAALAALLIGDVVEAAAIGAVLVINTALGFVVELRARRAMEALLRYQALSAVVVRGGRPVQVDAAELVPGDVVILQAGDAVPADARVLEAAELRTTEAALTGESMPVTKSAEPSPAEAALPDRRAMVYAGTTVAAGAGRALVVATGTATELGRIGGMLGEIEEDRTPLERRLDLLGHRLAWIAMAVALLVGLLGWARGAALGLMLETAVALAIAAVPEGLPAVATIALAVGLRRMARRNALVRRLHAVEALGSATVVCADKTGTLTAGEMTVTRLVFIDRRLDVSGAGYAPRGDIRSDGRTVDPEADAALREALQVALLSARAEVTRDGDRWSVRGDPTDAALLVLGRKGGLDPDALREGMPPRGEVPFATASRLSASIHGADGERLALVKGAPAEVLDRCSRVRTADGSESLDRSLRERILAMNEALARDGLRVIALARGPVRGARLEDLRDLVFVCLAGLTDPPADGVQGTIERLRSAGIRTLMITGDQASTAAAVAARLGLADGPVEVVTGSELERMSDDALLARLRDAVVFSRVSPDRKLDIVRLLQQRGEIVAMLGDGVNDAAALKQADVGVAMGGRGTDVAREVAAVVLQDDRFPTIGAAVEEGRVIHDNIRKFIFYLFSCNLAEVLVLLVAGLAGLALPILPLQILWLNLVTDTFPALALALEPGEPGVMRRPPREPRATILSRHFMRAVAFYASIIMAVTLAAFLWGLRPDGRGYEHAVTLSFMTLALAQLFHLGTARSTGAVLSGRRAFTNRFALGAVALVILLQVLAVELRPLARILDLRPLAVTDWAIVAGLSLIPAVIGQLLRLRRQPPGRPPAPPVAS